LSNRCSCHAFQSFGGAAAGGMIFRISVPVQAFWKSGEFVGAVRY
jgi:hypothetical protein